MYYITTWPFLQQSIDGQVIISLFLSITPHMQVPQGQAFAKAWDFYFYGQN